HWVVGGDLIVGDSSTGTLTIGAGGTVVNDWGVVGNSNGGVGTLTVTGRDAGGAASTWTSQAPVHIGSGSGSNGTLWVLDGALAQGQSAAIGVDGGSTGNVTVSGIGSVWQLSTVYSFQVGASGSGTLRIDNGGAVHSGQGM